MEFSNNFTGAGNDCCGYDGRLFPFFWTNIVYYFLSFILMVFVLFVSVIWILVERPVYTFDTKMLSP